MRSLHEDQYDPFAEVPAASRVFSKPPAPYQIHSCVSEAHYSCEEAAVTQLDNCWDGSAATAAISKFNEIKSKFFDARYNVLDNYVNFLLQQVGEGYTQTEDTNVSLADQFK